MENATSCTLAARLVNLKRDQKNNKQHLHGKTQQTANVPFY